jgi:hypothetical protein
MLAIGDTNNHFGAVDIYRFFDTRNITDCLNRGKTEGCMGESLLHTFFPGDTYSLLSIGDV